MASILGTVGDSNIITCWDFGRGLRLEVKFSSITVAVSGNDKLIPERWLIS